MKSITIEKDKEIIDILNKYGEKYEIIDNNYKIIFDDISLYLYNEKGKIEIKKL